jgi:hypothetical protein
MDANLRIRNLKFAGAACLMVAALAQMWRLRQARRHQEVIVQRLAGEPKYQHIKVGVATTNGGGRLLVSGTLTSDADLQALKEIITSTKPPASVDYRVTLLPK